MKHNYCPNWCLRSGVLVQALIKHKYQNFVSDIRFSEILIGSIWALGARIMSTVFAFAFSVLVARLYGAKSLGVVAVINSFLMLATIFTVLGTQISILRLIPEHLTKFSPTSAFKVYRKTQYMVLGISVITGTIFFFSAHLIADKFFSKPQLANYFALASVFIVFQSLMTLNTQAVRGLRLVKAFAVMQLLPQVFNLLILTGVSLVRPEESVPVYAVLLGFAATAVIGSFIMDFAFKKKMKPNDIISPVTGIAILSISLPMLMTNTMVFIIGQTGVLILGMSRSESEVGYYAIAVKLATLTAFLLNAVNSMVAPKFSELFYSKKMDDLFHVAKKSAKLIFIVTTPILLCLLFLGRTILGLFFGQDFTVVYPAMVLLIIGQFVNSISGSAGIFLNMTGNQSVFRNIMLIAAALNITLNLSLIPCVGTKGAAFAAMTSLCFWNISTLIYMKIKFGKTTGYFPKIL